jgi:hypothetical protein
VSMKLSKMRCKSTPDADEPKYLVKDELQAAVVAAVDLPEVEEAQAVVAAVQEEY